MMNFVRIVKTMENINRRMWTRMLLLEGDAEAEMNLISIVSQQGWEADVQTGRWRSRR